MVPHHPPRMLMGVHAATVVRNARFTGIIGIEACTFRAARQEALRAYLTSHTAAEHATELN